MKLETLVKLFAFSGAAICIGAVTGFAGDGGNCRDVGGGVLTNFLDQTHAQGPITGDLRGAVAVEVLGVNGNVYHIAKQLVTDTGDTVSFSDTDLTTYTTSVSGLVAAQETIKIVGGTGHFDGATGTLSFFGAINGGEVTLRYDGTVCFRSPSAG
jgi:hypothetical protein